MAKKGQSQEKKKTTKKRRSSAVSEHYRMYTHPANMLRRAQQVYNRHMKYAALAAKKGDLARFDSHKGHAVTEAQAVAEKYGVLGKFNKWLES